MMKLLHYSETKILLCLLLMLAALEAGARLFETQLSADVKHIRELPSIAVRLKSAPGPALKVLIIGNSLTRDGLDRPLLKEALAAITHRPVELAAMYPDASNINQWFYGYRRYFDQTGAHPDLVFIGTARSHLLDNRSDPGALAAFYSSLSDLPHLMLAQKGDMEAISKALLSRCSYLFAHRGRVQPLVFYNLVPGYTETTQALAVRRPAAPEVNEISLEIKQTPTSAPENCQLLNRLLTTLNASKVRVFVVAIPMTTPYELPSSVRNAVTEAGGTVLEKGAAMQLPAERFPDGYHLDASGSGVFTEELTEVLKQNPAWFADR